MDFWPCASSLLRGAADPGFLALLDINAAMRTSPFDVGAYEAQGLAVNPGGHIASDFKLLTKP
jgi:hypothetical protein